MNLLSFNIFSEIRIILSKENILARHGGICQESQDLKIWDMRTLSWEQQSCLTVSYFGWDTYCSPGFRNSGNPSISFLSARIVEKEFLINVTLKILFLSSVVVHAFCCSIWEADLRVQDQPGLKSLLRTVRTNKKPCLRKQKKTTSFPDSN